MTSRPLLDTHVWIWWLLGDPRLSRRERDALDELPSGSRPVICDISLWEVTLLVQLGRLELEDDLETWLRIAASPAAVEVMPITTEVVVAMSRLPSSFHHDPADRLMVSTARALGLPLARFDDRIRRSGLVSIWSAS